MYGSELKHAYYSHRQLLTSSDSASAGANEATICLLRKVEYQKMRCHIEEPDSKL